MKYSGALARRTLEPWLRGSEESDTGENPGYCALCEDPDQSASASARYNFRENRWYCHKSEHGGTIADLLSELSGGKVKPAARRRKPAATAKPLADQDAPETAHAALVGGNRKSSLDYLITERGLSRETIDRWQLGLDSNRFTIPIRESASGPWLNIRRYRRNAPDDQPKMTNTPGHGSPPVLAFTEALDGNSLPVIVTEGEFDCLLTLQNMQGRAVAVTGTGGAAKVPADLSRLHDRDVWIAYDADTAGRDGAAKIAQTLADRARVHVLDVTALGLPFSDKHGADLTDFWRQGGTPEQILTVMHAAAQVEGDDEVLAYMRAAFLSAGEAQSDYVEALLTEDDILESSPMRYVVEPFIPRGMASVIFGEPGTGKTFVGQDIGGCVRAGIPWHGHPTARGGVLLLEAEGVQQLQARIVAWREHYGDPEMAPFRALDEPFDLSSPDGCAALVRTARGMADVTGVPVELIWVDPAALYMSTGENEDGNRNLIVGLNAVAKYLDIGVLLITHTNASGERGRGTEHPRMLSGSYMKVERLAADRLALVQLKVKNAQERAVILNLTPVGNSLALDLEQSLSAAAYAAQKSTADRTSRAADRIVLSETHAAAKTSKGEALLLAAVTANPGIGRGRLIGACKSQGIGDDLLGVALDRLIAARTIRVEVEGSAKNSPQRHYLSEPEA